MDFNDLPIKISDEAFNEIVSLFQKKNIDRQLGLRIGIKGNGCSGTSFIIGFDKETEFDKVYQTQNFNILIEKKHFMYLIGMQLDFVNNNDQKGFVFNSLNK